MTSTPRDRPRVPIWLVALVVLVVAGMVLAVALSGTEVAGRPRAHTYENGPPAGSVPAICRDQGGTLYVAVFFEGDTADDAMGLAADELGDDERIDSLERETRQQAYERFKVVFEDDPELVEQVSPEALPAALWIVPADGVTRDELAAQLGDELTTESDIDPNGCRTPR